jgi:hypothetical protein
MIQLVVNVELLREIDERKLINAYARFMYNNEKDTTDDIQIKENLKQLLDWDKNGDNGLGVYCSKFEKIKRKDWEFLINFIKENSYEIELLSRPHVKEKRLESIKIINDVFETKKQHNIKRFTDENYEVSGRGKKARPCIYEGREYKSRQECMYKEGLTKYQLWIYLKNTNQI